MDISVQIGELARRANCPVETIRYYERERLLPPAARSAGNFRLYGAAHLARLSFIRRCRSLDLTLAEIRTLLHYCDSPAEACHAVNQVLDAHIDHVTARITELKQLEQQLQRLREQCNDPRQSRDCRILHELSLVRGHCDDAR